MKMRILDGAMGTELMKRGCGTGPCPEEVNLTAPEVVQEIQRAYVEAGSEVLYTCTFGVNRRRVKNCTVPEVVAAAIRNARAAAQGRAEAWLDIGMLGAFLEPLGDLPESEAEDMYAELFTAGKGADGIILETFFDLHELCLAVSTARRVCPELPVRATMTFQPTGRTFTGSSIPEVVSSLEAAGAAAVGMNCSFGPEEALPLVREFRESTDLPLIVKLNAGTPDLNTGIYPLGPEAYAEAMGPILDLDIQYVGGCCGTTPEYIRALKAVCR